MSFEVWYFLLLILNKKRLNVINVFISGILSAYHFVYFPSISRLYPRRYPMHHNNNYSQQQNNTRADWRKRRSDFYMEHFVRFLFISWQIVSKNQLQLRHELRKPCSLSQQRDGESTVGQPIGISTFRQCSCPPQRNSLHHNKRPTITTN